MKHFTSLIILQIVLLGSTSVVMAAVNPVATWNFNNSLNAQQPGIPSLSAVDPMAASYFVIDTVFGESRWVYRFDGERSPATNQAGLMVPTVGFLDNDAYSVDIVFMFDIGNGGRFNNVMGTSNRTSDNALYINPSNNPFIYPTGGGSSVFTYGEYHRLTLVNRGDGSNTAVYLNGIEQFHGTTSVLDFSTYATQNPNNTLTFFLDNIPPSPFTTEWSSGSVASIRIYNVELSGEEVAAIPVPGALWLFGSGLFGLFGLTRRGKIK